MGPLVLAKNFLMVADVGQAFQGGWLPIDSEFQNATVHVHCQTLWPPAPAAGFTVKVQSSFDSVESYLLGAAIAVNATGSQSAPITSNIGRWCG